MSFLISFVISKQKFFTHSNKKGIRRTGIRRTVISLCKWFQRIADKNHNSYPKNQVFSPICAVISSEWIDIQTRWTSCFKISITCRTP